MGRAAGSLAGDGRGGTTRERPGPEGAPNRPQVNNLPHIPKLKATRVNLMRRSKRMQLGMIGLARMGANMVRRLMRGGHECVVFDMSPESVNKMAADGSTGAGFVADFVQKLEAPRAVW